MKLVKCNFTVEELEYILDLIARERILTAHVDRQLKGLRDLGVLIDILPIPNFIGKIQSYIKKGKQ